MIIWMGYHNRKDWDDDGNPFWAWNDANGNTMDPYSGADFWGMEYFNRDGVTYDGSPGLNTATINDEAGNELFVVDYDVNQADPTCIGVSYEYNEDYDAGASEDMYKLQWREFSCRRSGNAVCEIDFKKNKQCFFGTADEPQFITTDKWALDVAGDAPCKHWERCFEGQINQGSCAEGYLFSSVLRECVPEGDPTIPDSCYVDPCNPYGMSYCGDGYKCVNPTNCLGLDVASGGNCIVHCEPLNPSPSDECNAGCIPEAECVQEIQCPEVRLALDLYIKLEIVLRTKNTLKKPGARNLNVGETQFV